MRFVSFVRMRAPPPLPLSPRLLEPLSSQCSAPAPVVLAVLAFAEVVASWCGGEASAQSAAE